MYEQSLIGAVLVLGRQHKHSQRWLKALSGWDFSEPVHSWIWGQLRKGELTDKTVAECRRRFSMCLVVIVARCLEQELWWWGDWYVIEIKEAALRRSISPARRL